MFDEAIAEYEATLEVDPYHTQALFRIANLYLQEGQYRRAIQFYKRFLLLVPDEKIAWNNLGSAYEGMEDFVRAEKTFRHVLTLDPCHEDANYGLAKATYLQGWSGLSEDERKDVICRLHFVLSLDPDNHDAESLVRCLENER
jgi:tetratricopeptide (TPR) repeat protein